ncbi:hypothetical protein [Armatimonas sp.]|uniref:hypothetical protein n=1 Tax=Armatimonas sp. TaxID=1872638 RepID=UPI00286D33F6|nr:hypothetical protein [Armatimonas sp.]
MRQQQQARQTTHELEEKLWKQLAYNNADSARETLAPLESSDALQLLIRVLARDETKTVRKSLLTKSIFVVSFGLLGTWALFHIFRDPSKFDSDSLLPVGIALFIATILSGAQTYSPHNRAVLLIPDLLPRLSRTDLSLVLELASQAKLDDLALLSWLGHGLGRMPIDELAALSPEARQGLRLLTKEAIERSKTEQQAEALAIAGLLALGSLKDTSLKNVAERAVLQHTRGHVCAAAEEYLTQIAK